MWQQALDIFLSYYEPCSNAEESDEQFTTSQLYGMLEQHCGGNMSITEMTNYLIEKKFTYDYTTDLVFEWLLKRKTPKA